MLITSCQRYVNMSDSISNLELLLNISIFSPNCNFPKTVWDTIKLRPCYYYCWCGHCTIRPPDSTLPYIEKLKVEYSLLTLTSSHTCDGTCMRCLIFSHMTSTDKMRSMKRNVRLINFIQYLRIVVSNWVNSPHNGNDIMITATAM